MRDILKKFGIRKMDEMEKNIALKAQRNALLYVYVLLTAWIAREIYRFYTDSTVIDLFPVFLLVTIGLVREGSRFFYEKKAVEDDEDYRKENPIYKQILLGVMIAVIVVIGVISLIIGWFIKAGN